MVCLPRLFLKRRLVPTLAIALALLPLAQGAAQEITIVGSSTVYPFTAAVSERFARKTGYAAPIVESTGTGGGVKLFCAGIDRRTPDITNASSRIKRAQLQDCFDNGVTDVVEVHVGYDGIVMAHAKGGALQSLTRREVFLALANKVPDPQSDGQGGADTLIPNPYTNWKQINPSLPDLPIEVVGPPPTSGTRVAFLELVMDTGAKTFPGLKQLDKKEFRAIARYLREDGKY
nr:substrate-binding domain-containing protein [Alphaproteobacteria bacterium]